MHVRDEPGGEQRLFFVWLGFAAAAHAALIAALLFSQFLFTMKHPPLKVVNVSLVSLPGSSAPGGESKPLSPAPPAASVKIPRKSEQAPVKQVPVTQPPRPPVPAPVPPLTVGKKMVKAPVPVPAPVPTKAQASDERKNLQAALEKLRSSTAGRKSETAGAERSIGSALTALQKKVAAEGSGSSVSGSGSGSGGFGSGGNGAFDPYKARIAAIIQGNWSFSGQMVRKASGMEVYVSLYIMPDGSVSQIRYDRISTSEYLNNSVKMALARSTPFPPLPKEGGARGIWVGFMFTPEGLGR